MLSGAGPVRASIDLGDTSSGSALPAASGDVAVAPAPAGGTNIVSVGSGDMIISSASPVISVDNSGAAGTNTNPSKLPASRSSFDSGLVLSEEQNRNLASLEGLNKNVDLVGQLVQATPSSGSKVAGALSPNDSLLSGSSTAVKPPVLLTAPASTDGILYNDSPLLPEAHTSSDQDNQ